jgi:hypothetical protein
VTALKVEFDKSAFKHGISEADIKCVVEDYLYNKVLDGYKGKNLVIGFDTHANLLEVVFNVVDDETINVFHAMKCRRIYLPLIKK